MTPIPNIFMHAVFTKLTQFIAHMKIINTQYYYDGDTA